MARRGNGEGGLRLWLYRPRQGEGEREKRQCLQSAINGAGNGRVSGEGEGEAAAVFGSTSRGGRTRGTSGAVGPRRCLRTGSSVGVPGAVAASAFLARVLGCAGSVGRWAGAAARRGLRSGARRSGRRAAGRRRPGRGLARTRGVLAAARWEGRGGERKMGPGGAHTRVRRGKG
jgi:hypothetical protein